MSELALLDERKDFIRQKKDGGCSGAFRCEANSLSGAVSQRACVYCGARVVLNPITDAYHIVHGPIGCASYTWDIRGSLSSGREIYRNSFSTDLKEEDVIFGGEKKLEAAIKEIADNYHPRLIFVYATCIVGVIGDDIEAVCKKMSKEYGIRVIPVRSPGFSGNKAVGYKMACNALMELWSRMNADDVKRSIACRPDIIHIGTPVSYIQIYSKLRKNKSWVIKNLLECVDIAKNKGIDVTVGFEDASRADIGFILSLAKELKKAEVDIIRIADTVGVLTPSRTKELIKTLVSYTDMGIELHIHNDLGMAVANSLIGAIAGAKFIDCTLFGIGERTGNCNLYDFVHAADVIFDLVMNKKQIKQIEKELYDMFKHIIQ